jgi:hypothetical protein
MPGTALGSRLTVNQIETRTAAALANTTSNAEQLGVRKQWEENGAQLHVAVAGSCLSRLLLPIRSYSSSCS